MNRFDRSTHLFNSRSDPILRKGPLTFIHPSGTTLTNSPTVLHFGAMTRTECRLQSVRGWVAENAIFCIHKVFESVSLDKAAHLKCGLIISPPNPTPLITLELHLEHAHQCHTDDKKDLSPYNTQV